MAMRFLKYFSSYFSNLAQQWRQLEADKQMNEAAFFGDNFLHALDLVDKHGANINAVSIVEYQDSNWPTEDYERASVNIAQQAILKGNDKALDACLQRKLDVNLVVGGTPLLYTALTKGTETAAMRLIGAPGIRLDLLAPDLATMSEVAQRNGKKEAAALIQKKTEQKPRAAQTHAPA
jgi:hypothetical protein